MRIAINCRSILKSNRTGIGRYTYSLLESLGEIDTGNEYILYAQKGIFDFKRSLPKFSFSNFKISWDFLNQGSSRLEQKSDVYHLPSPQLIERSRKAKIVVTVHDMIYLTHPQGHTPATIKATTRQMESIVRHADHVICVSESTRKDLHHFLNFPQERSSVVYNGVDHRLFYPLAKHELESAREDLKGLKIEKPFVLFVGTIEPRKNLKGLLEAFALLKSRARFDGHLVVVGMKGWMLEEIHPLVERLGLKHDVIFCGFVQERLLRLLYALSEVFVFPSFYEGFGFPILEAFCCGAAVVTSNNSSCLEVAQDAALTVDPHDVPSLAQAIEKMILDKTFNSQMRAKGLIRAKDFSFKKTAQQTLTIYQALG